MPKKRKKTCEDLLRTAKLQLKRCCIPTTLAVVTSVIISKLGTPIIPVALIGAGGWAWWRGYRVRIVKPHEREETD